MARSIMTMFRYVILVCLAGSVVHYFVQNRKPVFSTAEVKKIAAKYAGQHPSETQFKISNDLRRKYARHVVPDNEQSWHLFSGGGAQGKVTFLHASLFEFINIAGSPLGMAGNLGINWYNESCTVLTGSVQAYRAGPLKTREEYNAGETIQFWMGAPCYIEAPADTWMMCHAKGFIPTSLPAAFLGSLSAGDPVSFGQMSFSLGTAVARESALSLSETAQFYMKKVGLGGK